MPENSLKTKKFFETLTLIVWLAFYIFLLLSGRFKIYIKKGYFPLMIFGITMLALTVYFNRRAVQTEKKIKSWDILVFIFFLLPVLLGLFIQPAGLSGFAAKGRGISLAVENSGVNVLEELKTQVETEGKYRKLNIKQILVIAKNKPDEIENQPVSVEGIVYKNKEPEKFVLVRFLITCCAADATPLGISVVWPQAESLKQDTWVRVRAVVHFVDGKPELVAENVDLAPAPSDLYLY